jgi:hypothetical protein
MIQIAFSTMTTMQSLWRTGGIACATLIALILLRLPYTSGASTAEDVRP